MNRTGKVLALALLVCGPALGASVTIEELWLRTNAGGDPVPGRPSPVVFRELSGTDASSRPVMHPPVINNSGQVVFRARSASQFDNNALNAIGIYAKRPSLAMIRLVDTTLVIPGTPTFPVPGRPAGTVFTDFKAPLLNNAGDVVFFARFTGAAGAGAGFYSTTVTGGPIVKLVDTFTTVPGFPLRTFRTFDFTIFQLLTASLNNNGQVVYWGDFLNPSPTVTNALFGTTVAGGAGTLLVDSTQVPTITPPLGGAGGFREVRPTPVLNDAGLVVFAGNLGPAPSFRNGVFAVPVTGGTVSTVAFTGQTAPGRTTTFANTFDPAGHSFDVNDSGVVVFRNGLTGSEFGNYSATLSGTGYTLARIIDTLGCTLGPCLPIPGESVPPAEYGGNVPPTVNESNRTAIWTRVDNTPVSNQQGIFATDIDGTPISVVANLSTAPPGLAVPVGGFPRFANGLIDTEPAMINDDGNIAFVGGGLLNASTSFRGLYFYDTCTAELSRVSDSTIALSQLGAAFNFSGGQITRYDTWQLEGRSGHLRSFNNSNDLAFAVAFSNFEQGMYIAHISTSGSGVVTVACPPNVSLECPANTDPSVTGLATATGCGTVTVSYSDVSTPGCGGTVSTTRTWSATNGSSTATCVQSIIEVDTTGPTFAGVPDKTSAECGTVPLPATVSATDACQGAVSVSLSETSSPGPCPGSYILTRTWTAVDGCGNGSDASHAICVIDTTNPTLMGTPADVSVECDAVPPPATITTADTCTVAPTITFSEARTNGLCADEYALARTWTATDDCGNSVSSAQIVTVDDTVAPTISCPAHATLECPANTSVVANGSATGSDNCGATTISSSDMSAAGCGSTQTITRTWSGSDDCGNSSSCVQYVAVVDTTAPVLTVNTAPITVTDVDCDGSAAATVPSGSASDACDGAVAVNHNAPALFPAGVTTPVIYTATDACGNSSTAQVNVTALFGANLRIEAARHEVGTGSHPGSTKTPLVGITACCYDKTDGSCPRTVCGGISHQEYQCVLDNCAPVGCCVTDSTGACTMNLPPGNYIVVSGDATKTTLPDPLGVSVGDVSCGGVIKTKHLQQIVKANGQMTPAKTTRLTGSELLIIEPEYVIWNETVQLYPFIFETIGDWSVTATVTPPAGFVADFPALSTDVDNSLRSVQFTIVEVGSDLVPTQTEFRVMHNGRQRTVRSKVDILLTAEYARSRGFDPEQLNRSGLIVEPARVERASGKGAPRSGSR